MTLRSMLVAVLLVAAPSAALAQEKDAIAVPVLRAEVTVESDVVRIGYMVDNAGPASQIAIYRSPDLGTTGTLPTAQVINALQAHQVIGVDTRDIKSVSVTLTDTSTSASTNAVVENRFSPVCTVLIGFDASMVERSGLSRAGEGGLIIRVDGGHGADGEELASLDEAAILRAVAEHETRVEAFAVAGNFSVRNPAHELEARGYAGLDVEVA